MTPQEKALAAAFLAEMWPVVREYREPEKTRATVSVESPAPYPCYCLPGPARCDDPYNWCDRPQRWHLGRRWNGPDRLSVECACPKTPCGLTEFGEWDPACDFHGLTKTTRQGHAPQDCPGREELG